MPIRIEVNCMTGERREIELTAQEISDSVAATAQELADKAARGPDPIDELRQAMKADASLLTNLKAIGKSVVGT